MMRSAATILLLLEREKQVVEPAGACSLAAVLNHKIDVEGKRVVCVLSGGNIDVSFIHKIVEKGLVTRGRNMKFRTLMLDVPGSLGKNDTGSCMKQMQILLRSVTTVSHRI